MRVLVIEDEELLASAVAEGLRAESLVVDVVHDGDAALEQLRRTAYDVLVLDGDLPQRQTDDDVHRAVIRARGSARVLMLTPTPDSPDAGLPLDVADRLAKPFAFGDLLDRVRKLEHPAGSGGEPAAPPEEGGDGTDRGCGDRATRTGSPRGGPRQGASPQTRRRSRLRPPYRMNLLFCVSALAVAALVGLGYLLLQPVLAGRPGAGSGAGSGAGGDTVAYARAAVALGAVALGGLCLGWLLAIRWRGDGRTSGSRPPVVERSPVRLNVGLGALMNATPRGHGECAVAAVAGGQMAGVGRPAGVDRGDVSTVGDRGRSRVEPGEAVRYRRAALIGRGQTVTNRARRQRSLLNRPHGRIAPHQADEPVSPRTEQLDQALDERRRILANASYALRTPLAINQVLLEVALRRPDAPAQLQQLCTTLLEVNGRQQKLVDNLLLLARSQQALAEPVPVDLADLAYRVCDALDPQARRAGIEMRVSVGSARTAGDPTLLEWLALHLMQNAVGYNSVDGWVRVATGTYGDRVRLTVANTGPVVGVHEIPALFEPFRRPSERQNRPECQSPPERKNRPEGQNRTEDQDRPERQILSERQRTSDRQDPPEGQGSSGREGSPGRRGTAHGTGLGLSIVRSIAQTHGGRVTAVPREGGGLVVEVTLPSS